MKINVSRYNLSSYFSEAQKIHLIFSRLYTFFLVLVGVSIASCTRNLKYSGDALGTVYHVIQEPTGTVAFEDVFDTFDRSMSVYAPDSDISKINRGDTTVVTDVYFRTVFEKSKEIWKATDGFFDPTVGSLLNAWGFGAHGGDDKIPSKEAIDSLLRLTGMQKVALKADGTVFKESREISLDFNAIAKGYCVDILAKRIEDKGAANFLVEIGGEIFAKGRNAESGKEWSVGIEDPRSSHEGSRALIATLTIKDRGMATSGNYRKFKIDSLTGQKYAHIINPKTGYPERSNTLSATVTAPTCMEADAYATAFMIMPIEQIKLTLAAAPRLEAFIIVATEGEAIKAFVSKGLKDIQIHAGMAVDTF